MLYTNNHHLCASFDQTQKPLLCIELILPFHHLSCHPFAAAVSNTVFHHRVRFALLLGESLLAHNNFACSFQSSNHHHRRSSTAIITTTWLPFPVLLSLLLVSCLLLSSSHLLLSPSCTPPKLHQKEDLHTQAPSFLSSASSITINCFNRTLFTPTRRSEQSLRFPFSRFFHLPLPIAYIYEASVYAPSLQPHQLLLGMFAFPPDHSFACSHSIPFHLHLSLFTPSLAVTTRSKQQLPAYINLFPFHHNLFLFHPLHSTLPSSTPSTVIYLLLSSIIYHLSSLHLSFISVHLSDQHH